LKGFSPPCLHGPKEYHWRPKVVKLLFTENRN